MPSHTGLQLGYNDLHPFSGVEVKDRASVQELLCALLDPLEPFFSPGRARVRFPGATAVRFDQTASEVEGLLRPLWGLAAMVAGDGDYKNLGLWVQGIKAGTDPEHSEYWGHPQDNDQRMVEMCPLGFALAVMPQLWNELSNAQKTNVEKWLGNSINEKNMPDTNWLWFRVFANLGLKKNGGKFSQETLDRDMKRLDTFYRGDGWSNDGPEGIHQMDYYSTSFAIQTLQLIYSKVAEEDDPERSRVFKERAKLVALDFVHYFDREGRAIPFGRSVIYRFAMVTFWSALAFADVDLPSPLTWGLVKGIVLRHLRWWQTQNDIWTSSGTLSIGYSFPNMYVAENYNSPGSPYWATFSFLCLAVPETHPFWSSAEEFTSAAIPKVKTLSQPGHIVSNLGGHCMLLSSGQACSYPMKALHAKYGGFAYSSAFGYSVPTGQFSLEQYALSSQLGLSDDNGETWRTRRLSEYAAIEHRDESPVLVSIWRPFPDVRIRTILVPPKEQSPNWHLRIHHIESSRDLWTADGSFAICNVNSYDGRYLGVYDERISEGTQPRIIGNYDLDSPDGLTSGRIGAFAVSTGAVGIKALDDGRQAMLVNADPNSNIMESRSTIPTLRHTIKASTSVWYLTAIYAKPSGAGVDRKEYLDGWNSPPDVPDWLKAEMDISEK